VNNFSPFSCLSPPATNANSIHIHECFCTSTIFILVQDKNITLHGGHWAGVGHLIYSSVPSLCCWMSNLVTVCTPEGNKFPEKRRFGLIWPILPREGDLIKDYSVKSNAPHLPRFSHLPSNLRPDIVSCIK